MKAHCLPFEQIPDSTRLFTDFLQYSPDVRPFYPHSPNFNEWVKGEASALQYDFSRRERVSEILARQKVLFRIEPDAHAVLYAAAAAFALVGVALGNFLDRQAAGKEVRRTLGPLTGDHYPPTRHRVEPQLAHSSAG